MADIYIVYASEDRGVAEKLQGLLAEQWDTWWDYNIVGEVQEAIEAEIPEAKCMIPIFSAHSRKKPTVISELNIGRDLNKKIIPIKIDNSKPPYSFDTLSIVDLHNWKGEVDHPGFKQLLKRLVTVVPPRKKPKRPITIAGGKVPLPSIFMSVSSFNTKILPTDAVKVLRAINVPTILVSAYDLVTHDESPTMVKEVKKFKNKGGFVLIDSGNYEASRLKDRSWDESKLEKALALTPHDWAFCFDNMDPSKGHKRTVEDVVEAVKSNQKFTSATVLPIIHAPELKKGGYKLEYFPQIVREVSENLEPPLIAIPERELGAGLIARAKMVRDIRKELNKLHYYQPLHLLGTGNPWAIAVLAAAGADTFDGLEWCRYTIDTDLEGINHFNLFDLFGTLNNTEIGFSANVAYHNLAYFKSFGNIMHDMFTQNKVESFVQGVLNKRAFNKLKEYFPEIFE